MRNRTFRPLDVLHASLDRACRIAAKAESVAARSQKLADTPESSSMAMALQEKAMEITVMSIHLVYQYMELLEDDMEDTEDPRTQPDPEENPQ